MGYSKIIIKIIMLFTILLGQNTWAIDFGTIGTTFPIAEDNVLEIIHKRLQDPAIQKKIANIQQQLKQKVLTREYRPIKVDVKSARENRRYLLNISTSIPNDLTDHQGNMFYRANTVVNPLEYAVLPRALLFIDGDNAKHLELASQYLAKQPLDVVLTSGAPFKIMSHLKTMVYFDQGGYLIKHFQIQAIPAMVRQQGKNLLVEELVV